MPGGFPIFGSLCNGADIGTVAATSLPTSVVSNATTANVASSYVQLIASTAADACWAVVIVADRGASSSAGFTVFNIAVGASGSEVIVFANIPHPFNTSGTGNTVGNKYCYGFPCSIPAGSRVAFKAQTAGKGVTMTCQLYLFDGAFTQIAGCAGAESIGTTVSSSSTVDTTVTASATINTKGSYSQIIAATTRDYLGFHVTLGQVSATAQDFLVDIAIGASGSELVIAPNLTVSRLASNFTQTPEAIPFLPISIPGGTRVAARCQSTVASALIGVSLVGVF